jgi:hypothetical protein
MLLETSLPEQPLLNTMINLLGGNVLVGGFGREETGPIHI